MIAAFQELGHCPTYYKKRREWFSRARIVWVDRVNSGEDPTLAGIRMGLTSDVVNRWSREVRVGARHRKTVMPQRCETVSSESLWADYLNNPPGSTIAIAALAEITARHNSGKLIDVIDESSEVE